MLSTSSYNVARFAAGTRPEVERLKAQVDLFWPAELELYRRAGLRPGMKVLDCGCGPGYLLRRLAREVGGLVCTGTDIDPMLVDMAAESFADLPGCRALCQSIDSLDLPANTFDFAICRLVLEHLSEPMSGLAEILRVLKPGGIAVVIDNDFDLHERTYPDCPALAELYSAYRAARRAEKGNPCIGRELPGLLRGAGFAGVALELISAHSELSGDAAFLRAEGAGIPTRLVQDGYLSAAALDRITAEWMAMLQAPGHSIFRLLFAAAGRKPVPTGDGGEIPEAARQLRESRAGQRFSPNGAEGPLTIETVREFVLSALARAMDTEPGLLNPAQSLIEMGIDSIAAVSFCNEVKSRFRVTLPVSEVLCGGSIDEIAGRVRALVGSPSADDRRQNGAIAALPRAARSESAR